MASCFTINETVNSLTAIFKMHKEERVCVIGTMCCGKTTLLQHFPHCIDMDAVAFSHLSDEEAALIAQTPWTNEIGDAVDRIVLRNVKIQPGAPVFGTVIVDCDAVVYLDIPDDLLNMHCKKRGASLEDAKRMKAAIEEDWSNHKAQNRKKLYYLMLTE